MSAFVSLAHAPLHRAHRSSHATCLRAVTMSSSSSSSAASSAALRVAVIGGGPVGATAAAAIARANPAASVTLFERRPSPESAAAALPALIGRNYNIYLSPRGVGALEAAGFPGMDDDGAFVRVPFAVMHRADGTAKTGAGGAVKGGRSVARADLTRLTLEWARAEGVDTRYGAELEEVRPEKKEVVMLRETGEKEVVAYDLLVGADGVSSTVREELCRLGKLDAKIVLEPVPWKTVAMPPIWALEACKDEETWNLAIHAFPARGSHIVAPPAAPRSSQSGEPEGRLAALVIDASTDLSQFATPEAVKAFFSTHYPGLVSAFARADEKAPASEARFDTFAEATASSPIYKDGRNVFCRQVATDETVILGDAAHAMSPALGQGANCGLESVPILVEALRQSNWDVKRALLTFNSVRQKDVFAATKLSQWGSSYHSTRRTLFYLGFVMWNMLHKIVPFLARRKLDRTDFSDPTVSYSQIAKRVFFGVRVMVLMATVVIVGLLAVVAPRVYALAPKA